jgi:hypothetical protein
MATAKADYMVPPPPSESITLTLTPNEARVIRAALGAIGGGSGEVHDAADRVYAAIMPFSGDGSDYWKWFDENCRDLQLKDGATF